MVVKKRVDNPGETVEEQQTSHLNNTQELYSTSEELQESKNLSV